MGAPRIESLEDFRTRTTRVVGEGRYLLIELAHPDFGQRFEPGQFASLETREGGALDPFLLRPFSVMDETRGHLRFLVLLRGRGTRFLFERKPGDALRLIGPLGQPFPARANVELVGGGSGIAPLVFYARRYPERVVRLRVGFRTAPPVFLMDILKDLPVPVEILTEDGTAGQPGRVLTGWIPRGETVFACGPLPMMRAVAARASDREVWVSLEETMGCGFGVCMGCATPRRAGGYARTCTEGPAFPVHRIRLDQVTHG